MSESLGHSYVNPNGIIHTSLLRGLKLKIGEVVGKFPIGSRPASSRRLVVISENQEFVGLGIEVDGSVKVMSISKMVESKKESKESKDSKGSKTEAICNNGCIIYDLMDRKEIEIVDKDDKVGWVEISIPKGSGLKAGDVVGTVENAGFKEDWCTRIIDEKGNWVTLSIDSAGVVKILKIDGVEETVSWNQSVVECLR